MEKQRAARQAALVKQLECGCPDSTCADGKSCSHPMRRLSSNKVTTNEKQRIAESNNNHVSSTTPNVLIGTRVSVLSLVFNSLSTQNCFCFPCSILLTKVSLYLLSFIHGGLIVVDVIS